jgi:hypothetical protein
MTPERTAKIELQNQQALDAATATIRAVVSAANEFVNEHQLVSIADGDTDGYRIALNPPVTADEALTFARLLGDTALAAQSLMLAGEQIVGMVAPPLISPSAGWNGTAGTGFGGAYGAVPVDPTRTTAKPVCRLIQPPNQYFTDELLIGVSAGANYQGSLANNMGLERVVVHFEGSTVDIDRPSWRDVECADGTTRSYFAWWVVLKRQSTNGHGQVLFEAVPKDATMQRRVIGPYQFSPQATLHDHQLEIAATPAEVAGVRYKTIAAALNYLRTNAKHNPLITITEAGTYDLTAAAGTYIGQGNTTITATAPVTISRQGVLPIATRYFRPLYGGLHFKGANITLDFTNAIEFYSETIYAGRTWFDGINIVNSGPFYLLENGGEVRNLSWLARNQPWFTECNISDLPSVGIEASLFRGNTVERGYRDVVNGCPCVLGNTITGWDSSDYREEIPAFSVTYTGGEATATIALTGANAATSRTMTVKRGATTSSIVITPSAYQRVTDVVDWLNTLTDVTATLLDDTRQSSYLGLVGGAGAAFGDTNIKGVTLTPVTMIDIHPDFAQSSNFENLIIADNVVTDCAFQTIFFTGNPCKDGLVLNNTVHNRILANVYTSQLNNAHSHVVIAHNTFGNQDMLLRTDTGGAQKYNPDAYCLFANNVFPAASWNGGTPDTDMSICDNHLMGGTITGNATGTTTGGTMASLLVDAAAGDFTPQGDLLANLKTARAKWRPNKRLRAAAEPAGAVA